MVRATRMFSVAVLAALFALLVVPGRALTNEKSVAVDAEDGTGVPEGWALTAAVSLWAACSRDVGECWLPSEDGQGAVGGGPIIPAGAGGFGDVPPEPQNADAPPPACEESEEEPDELGEVWCGPQSRGATCAALCAAEQGVVCPDGILHSVTKEAAWLYKCCGCKGKQQCWYITKEGRICTYQSELPPMFR
jgi:hypothetical protein